MAVGNSRQQQASAMNATPDPFLYERQPLLAEGPTSGLLPSAFQYNAPNGSQAPDALSSSQSMESYQQAPPSSWDLLDLGLSATTMQPYERLEDEAQASPKVRNLDWQHNAKGLSSCQTQDCLGNFERCYSATACLLSLFNPNCHSKGRGP